MLLHILFALAFGVLSIIVVAIGFYYYVLIAHMLKINKKNSGPPKTTNIEVFPAKPTQYERKAL